MVGAEREKFLKIECPRSLEMAILELYQCLFERSVSSLIGPACGFLLRKVVKNVSKHLLKVDKSSERTNKKSCIIIEQDCNKTIYLQCVVLLPRSVIRKSQKRPFYFRYNQQISLLSHGCQDHQALTGKCSVV